MAAFVNTCASCSAADPCVVFTPDDEAEHKETCQCGHKKNKHQIAVAAAASAAAGSGAAAAGLDDSVSSEDSFPGSSSACVNLVRLGAKDPFNGTLVRMPNGRVCVISLAHLMAERVHEQKVGEDGKQVWVPTNYIEVFANIQLQLRVFSLDVTAQSILLPWSRCVHWAKQYHQGSSMLEQVQHDVCVFELTAPLPANVESHALTLFDWAPTNPAKSMEPHLPSSKAAGCSLMLDSNDATDPITIKRMEARFDVWKTNRGYAYLDTPSLPGQSGTGLTDKKQRVVAVVSGNYTVAPGKETAVAVLATRHVQILQAGSSLQFQPGEPFKLKLDEPAAESGAGDKRKHAEDEAGGGSAAGNSGVAVPADAKKSKTEEK